MWCLTGEGPEGAALQRALRDRPNLVTGMRLELGLLDNNEEVGTGSPLPDVMPDMVHIPASVRAP